ncbi:hypothetical protein NLS1_26670 [Nocardioides sp. LS1]|nr:hypothetical protein NLS1_26670 [Nocardioides sp. LS1]
MSIIGADIMDGGYDKLEAVLRFNMLTVANAAGLSTRVTGFSWNGRASPAVVRALRQTQPGTELCVRDPHSYERLVSLHLEKLVQVSDMVFCFNQTEPYEPIVGWCDRMAIAGRRIVIVNASGLLMSSTVLLDEYRYFVETMLADGFAVLAVPHVIRPGDDDLAACRSVVRGLEGDDAVLLIGELLSPAQVAWVASKAFATLSGRMHLAIFSLLAARPAAVLSSQGKVSGLMALTGLDDFILSPAVGLGREAVEAIRRIARDPAIAGVVQERLASLRGMALDNFVGLR